MNAWETLGIDPTDEQRKIKRAYSRRIATCHPEDDPEGFQKLQAAYEFALAFARGEIDEYDPEEMDDSEMEEAESVFASHEEDETADRPAERRSVVFADATEARLDAIARMERQRGESTEPPANDMGFISEFLKEEQEAEQRRMDELAQELETLRALIDAEENLEGYFKRGVYQRYADVVGFEEQLVEMLGPYTEHMNVLDVSELQDAIGYDQKKPGPLATLFDNHLEKTSILDIIKDTFAYFLKA